MREISGEVNLIYYPTSFGVKHEYYFSRFKCQNKVFIPWRPHRLSDTLTDILAWWKIPKEIRGCSYSEIFIASIGSIPFSMLVRKNPNAQLNTFDDGAFNIVPDMFLRWVDREPIIRRLAKFFLNGVSNIELIDKGARHYTIFNRSDIVGIPYEICELSLFRKDIKRHRISENKNRKVRVLLGTISPLSIQQDLYCFMRNTEKFDLILPHPAENRSPIIKDWVKRSCAAINIEKLIAEDAIFELARAGLKPIVYGFNSTALLTLSGFAHVVNLEPAGADPFMFAPLMDKFGVRLKRCWRYQPNYQSK